MKTKIESHKSSPINTDFLTLLFDKLRKENPTYYILFRHTSPDLFAIQQIYDYRLGIREVADQMNYNPTLRWMTVHDFLEYSSLFHEKDRFRVLLLNGVCSIDDRFETDVIITLLKQDVTLQCRMALQRDDAHKISAAITEKFGLSPEEIAEVTKIIDEINKEIITDLQFQYDHLKTLSFIEK